jgi:predicted hydrocarbon binding protein
MQPGKARTGAGLPSRKRLSVAEVSRIARPTLGAEMPVALFRVVRLIAMEELLGRSVGSMLYNAGEKIGLTLDVKTPAEFVQLVEALKIGKVTVAEATAERIVVDVYECVTCSGLEKVGYTLCHFEAGLIAGGLQKITGALVFVKETRCIGGLGDPMCRMEAAIKAG